MKGWRRRRGFALLTMAVALLIVAVAMDRLAVSWARDRAEAEAAAAFTFVRSVSEAALFTGADPVAAGALPHLSERRDLVYTYIAVPGGVDRMSFAWPEMSAVARAVLGNRIGEWLGRNRVTTPIELALDEVPLPHPERVLRAAPSMQVPLESAGIRATGTLAAAEGEWNAGSAGALTVTPPVSGEDSGMSAGTLTVGASVTASRLRSANAMGVPDAVTLTITAPPSGEAALRLDTLTTGTLDVSARLGSNRVTVTNPAPAEADALARSSAVVLDLAAATFEAVTAGSVRARNTTTTTLEVTSSCIGCTP
ncbi:MAG: hypothetical protein OXF40_10490 [Rhodospirillales bacterium]|nr:hypothetical protein [Rhodospirillales bacterium]